MVALLLTFTIVFAAEKPTSRAIAPPKCYSEQDVKDEGCRTLCVRDGYTGGKAYKKGCSCYDVKDSLEEYASGRVTLGVRMHTLKGNDEKVEVHVENRPPWDYSNSDSDE